MREAMQVCKPSLWPKLKEILTDAQWRKRQQATLTRHARRLVLQMAEVAVTRDSFAQILSRIRRLKPVPT
jgi:hypothetical protein